MLFIPPFRVLIALGYSYPPLGINSFRLFIPPLGINSFRLLIPPSINVIDFPDIYIWFLFPVSSPGSRGRVNESE